MKVLFLLVAFVEVAVNAKCPDGWVGGPSENCYKFVTTPRTTWTKAQGQCRDMGGILANLLNWNEIFWLRGYRHYHANLQEVAWIGAHRVDGEWVWESYEARKPMIITDWAKGEPNNSKGQNEDCVQVLGNTYAGAVGYQWNDAMCDKREKGFICEKPLE